ncbi:MAG TPA: NfeD family protein [Syntrophales bacterium]|nr:NfeD family protein [Syntrophobacterales bacterium]HNQ01343.1 NfeD family protein [Syntrophales bacterium]HQL90430.1 NfeD family protein [Syntrophales bacterium]
MKRIKDFRMLPGRTKRSVLLKYAVYQIPDTALAFLVLWILVEWAGVSLWLAFGLACLWILKDILIFPLLWHSFAEADPANVHGLVGEEGVVMETCDPQGYVRVRGETWKAASEEQGAAIDAGVRVVVTGNKGLTLYVRPKE